MRKTLLFDLDGTLLNTLEDLRDSTNFALRTYGYPERSLEVRRFVGNGLKMLLTRAVPQGSSEVEIERALACMKAHYCENYHNKTVPYPGIPELLQRLQIMHAVYPHLQAFSHLCLPDCGSILGLQSLCLLIEQFSLPCQDHTSAFTRKKREPDLLLQRSDLLADSGRHYAALLSGPCKTPTAHRA